MRYTRGMEAVARSLPPVTWDAPPAEAQAARLAGAGGRPPGRGCGTARAAPRAGGAAGTGLLPSLPSPVLCPSSRAAAATGVPDGTHAGRPARPARVVPRAAPRRAGGRRRDRRSGARPSWPPAAPRDGGPPPRPVRAAPGGVAAAGGAGAFVRVEGVEPTNRGSGRSRRPAGLWRQGSLGSESAAGSRCAERRLPGVATGRRPGRRLVAFLVAAGQAAGQGPPAPALLPARQGG